MKFNEAMDIDQSDRIRINATGCIKEIFEKAYDFSNRKANIIFITNDGHFYTHREISKIETG